MSWTAVVNCSVVGNSLQKTGGRDDSYDAGAISSEEISGNAFVEFTTVDSTKALFCGLARNPIGTHFEQIDFSIKLTSFGVAEVREMNTYRSETPYRAGDVLRIVIQNGQVGYYKNGGQFYSSTEPAVFPVRVVAALQSMGAKITDVSIGGLAAEPIAEWSAYQHDESHSGFSPGSKIGIGNVSSLSESWSFQTGGWVTGTPIVSGGVVYAGSWDGHMYALREADGVVIWSFDAGTISPDRCGTTYGIDGTAALSGGHLYFGSGRAELIALTASSGEPLWRTQLADPNDAYHIWASPTVFDGKIYIGLASHCVNPCVAGRLVCVSANDGHVIWSFNTAPPSSTGGAVWSSVAADPDHQLVFVGTGNYCTGDDTHSTSILALNADTGSLVWEFKKLHADLNNLDFGASPVLFDLAGTPALAIPCKDGHCYALNRVTGELLWDSIISDGDSRGGSISSPAAAYGRLYMGATVQITSGKVVALDQRDGHIVWEHALAKPVLGAAAVTGGVVFFGSDDKSIHAFDVSTGAELWNAQRASMLGGVSISRAGVFIGSLDHRVYAFSLPSSTDPTTNPTISVSSPAAGEVWRVKSKHEVAWRASSGVSRVDISISRDGGSTWAMIATGVDAATGSFRIKAKKPRSDDVMIRVVDSSEPVVSGVTGVFRID